MASITLTPSKTQLTWLSSGTIAVGVVLNGNGASFSTILSIDTAGNVTNSNGDLVGTLTATQLTALQNLATKIDSLIAAADTAGKLTF